MLSKLRRLKLSSSKELDPLLKKAPLQEQPDHGLLKKRIPATEEVVSTSELLTMIFSYLTPSTLILSVKRVCRTWYSVISNPSVDLQVSLFLRPAPDDSTLFTTPTTNDLLKSAFPFWLLEKSQLPRPGMCSCAPNKCGSWSTTTSTTILPWKQNPSAWQRNFHAWREMLVTQPPRTQLEFWKLTGFKSDEPLRRNKTHFVVECPRGVTLGILYDIVEGWIREAKDKTYISEYREKTIMMQDENAWEDFDVRYRGQWDRKELYLCDNWQERCHLLFLHLDLDRYSLTQV